MIAADGLALAFRREGNRNSAKWAEIPRDREQGAVERFSYPMN